MGAEPVGAAPASRAPAGRRGLAGAVLLDLAATPLFLWDVYTTALSRGLSAPPTALTGLFSVGLVAFVVAVVLGGRVADRVAPRRLALLCAGGSAAGLLGAAVAGSLPGVVLPVVSVGASGGLGYTTAVRVAGSLATARGLALGVVVSAYAVGAAVLAPIVAVLVPALGARATLALLACGIAPVLLLAAVLVPGDGPARRVPVDGPVRSAVEGRARSLGALWIAFGCGSAPALAAFAQAGAVAGSPSAAPTAVTLLNVGNVVGRLVAGPLSDRLGRRAALHGTAVVLALACLPLASGARGPAALTALLLLGIQYGALSTLVPAASADLAVPERLGTTMGLVFSGWGLAGLLAPTAVAAGAARIGVDGVFVVLLGFAGLVAGCAAMLRTSPPPHPGSRRVNRPRAGAARPRPRAWWSSEE